MPANTFRTALIIGACIILVLIIAMLCMRACAPLSPAGYVQPKGTIVTASRTIPVLIAETSEETMRGLSGMRVLPADEGMLFLFDHSGKFGFWMPEMHFAIDIIWIDGDWKVVDVSHHATPESFETNPKTVFYPRSPARYVLEVNDGMAKAWGIASGTTLTFTR